MSTPCNRASKSLLTASLAALFVCLTILPSAAQAASPNGSLVPGGSEILDRALPPVREPSTPPTASSVRTVIIPMPAPDMPIRIRFDAAIDIAAITKTPGTLNRSVTIRGSTAKGEWRWENSRELRFIPAAGSVSVEDSVNVRISGKVPLAGGVMKSVSASEYFYVESFRMGGKSSGSPVLAGSPRFVTFLDSGLRKIGEGPLYLLYDQAVNPEVIGAGVTATCAGKKLDLTFSRPGDIPFDRDGIFLRDNIVAVSILKLPPDGAVIDFDVPEFLSGDSIKDTAYGESFIVTTDFRWSSPSLDTLRSGTVARLSNSWDIEFSTPFDPVAFEAAFSVTPRPPRLDFRYSYSGTSVTVLTELDIGKVYSIKFDQSMTDLLGNRLKTPAAFAIKSQDLPSSLEIPKYTLLLETGANRLPVKYRNLKELRVATHTFADAASFIRILTSDQNRQGFDMQASPEIKVSPAELAMNTLYQAEFGIGKESGLKLIEVRAAGRGSESSGTQSSVRTAIQTSDIGVSCKVSDGAVFVWVTRLSSALSVPGATCELFDSKGIWLGKAVTAQDGTALINSSNARGSALKETLYVAATSGKDMSVCRLSNDEMSSAWQFNLPGLVDGNNPLAAAIFTERGAYRPGETVHIKGFVRELPEYGPNRDVSVTVKDPRGQEAFTGKFALDAYRGCTWDYAVPQGAAIGEYSIDLALGPYHTSRSFRVEEYRVPTFQVAVSSPDPEWLIERPVVIKALATYLKGGALGGKPFSWRVYRQPATFSPAGFPGYIFSLERDLSASGTVYDEEGKLNPDGSAALSFVPAHPDSAGPMLYIAQAAVTDSDRQSYAGRVARVVHATDLYVGARPPPVSIVRAGGTMSFPFVVTDTAGTVVAGRKVRVFVDRISYDQNTMLDENGRTATYNRQVISSQEAPTALSAAAPASISVAFPNAGHYQVRLECQDRGGRTASTAFIVTANGNNSATWPRFDHERIDIVLDKAEYRAGDIASIVAQSPFESARGLVTIEANGVIDRYPFTINANTPKISFPVKASYAPNAYVSVLLIRGRTHYEKDATGFETGAPAYRIGYARIEVDPSAQRLSVALDKKTVTTGPGTNATVSFTVTDAAGKPTDASATVMVVDEAVLGLTGYTTPDPIAMAYSFRVLGVRNASNILDLPYSRRSRFEVLFPGGDSDGAANIADSDDILRRLFKSTAFYSPSVPVGPNGKASVTFKLPDNMTTYRVMVVAANKSGQMGSGEGAILIRRALVIEPVAPRFAYEGDRFVAQAQVFNGTAADAAVQVDATLKGMTPATQAQAKVSVAPGNSAMIDYPVTVEKGAPKATFKFAAASGTLKDAVEYSIPVRNKGDKQSSVANGIISGSGTVVLPLPKEHSPGTVEIVISQTPLSELKDSVTYLIGYPNGCIEQTTSTAYPLVVLKDLLPLIGVEVSAAELKKYSEAGVERILSFQVNGGGLSYWPGGNQPHAFATAFGLTALIEAKKKGYNVSDKALSGMADYLEATLRQGAIQEDIPHGGMADGDTRALFVMTLGRLGRPQASIISDLWRAKDKLTPFGLSFLAVAVKESNTNKELLAPILAEIKRLATVADAEAFFDGTAKGGWSFDSPLRTSASSLIAYAVANNDAAMSQKLLKGLLNRRQGGLWGNTQENVFGIMGIYQLVAVAGNLEGKSDKAATPQLTVTLNGKQFPASAFERNSLGVLRLTVPESSLGQSLTEIRAEVSGGTGGGSYVTVRGSYDVPVSAELLAPRSQGFAYTRVYETMDGRSLEGADIPLGSIVKVRLKVRNDANRHYVAVDDMLPAGLEPLNTELKTTATIDMGTLSDVVLKTRGVTSYSEMRDHRVAFYADEMLAGDYEFVYLARATTAGSFFRPAGRAEAMYQTDEYGTSGGGMVNVK